MNSQFPLESSNKRDENEEDDKLYITWWNNLNNSEECSYMFKTKQDLIAIQDHYQSNKKNTQF